MKISKGKYDLTYKPKISILILWYEQKRRLNFKQRYLTYFKYEQNLWYYSDYSENRWQWFETFSSNSHFICNYHQLWNTTTETFCERLKWMEKVLKNLPFSRNFLRYLSMEFQFQGGFIFGNGNVVRFSSPLWRKQIAIQIFEVTMPR